MDEILNTPTTHARVFSSIALSQPPAVIFYIARIFIEIVWWMECAVCKYTNCVLTVECGLVDFWPKTEERWHDGSDIISSGAAVGSSLDRWLCVFVCV